MVISNTTTQIYSSPVICSDIAVIFGKCNTCSQEKQFAEILFDYCAGIYFNENSAVRQIG